MLERRLIIAVAGAGVHLVATAAASDATGDDLAREARLEPILQIALARNPALGESHARAEAAAAGQQAAGRWQDPELKYEQWGVPLSHPASLQRADTLMLGVRQTLPVWGAGGARERIAGEDAASARDAERLRRLDVVVQVKRTYADYARADHELLLHREHAALTSRLVELARLNYQTGRGTQQDVLRLSLELSRLHADLARIDQEKRSSQALLNTLMGRRPDAVLGPVRAALQPPPAPPPVGDLEKGLDDNRAEIAMEKRALRRDEAAVDLVRRSARLPVVMVGVDYWYMPMNDEPHGYGAMVSMSLPWLSGKRQGEVAQAERTLSADEQALQAQRNAALWSLHDAAARAEAAREGFAIIERDLLPQAQHSYQAAESAYGVGQGDALGLLDALRSYLQVRVERIRAIARMRMSLADLERAAGKELSP